MHIQSDQRLCHSAFLHRDKGMCECITTVGSRSESWSIISVGSKFVLLYVIVVGSGSQSLGMIIDYSGIKVCFIMHTCI